MRGFVCSLVGVAALVCLPIVGCSSSGDGEGGGAGAGGTAGSGGAAGTGGMAGTGGTAGNGGTGGGEPRDVSGSWSVVEIADETDCGAGIETYNYTLLFEQEGSDLTIWLDADAFAGSINGDEVSWSGSIDEEGGVTTYSGVLVTLNAAGDQMEGGGDWSWTDGVDSCAGDSTMNLTKN